MLRTMYYVFVQAIALQSRICISERIRIMTQFQRPMLVDYTDLAAVRKQLVQQMNFNNIRMMFCIDDIKF